MKRRKLKNKGFVDDVILSIYSFLNLDEAIKGRRVSKQYNTLLNSKALIYEIEVNNKIKFTPNLDVFKVWNQYSSILSLYQKSKATNGIERESRQTFHFNTFVSLYREYFEVSFENIFSVIQGDVYFEIEIGGRIGKQMYKYYNYEILDARCIITVQEDFHSQDFHNQEVPMRILIDPKRFADVNKTTTETLGFLKKGNECKLLYNNNSCNEIQNDFSHISADIIKVKLRKQFGTWEMKRFQINFLHNVKFKKYLVGNILI
jgi:hypothetical protein